MKTFGKCKGGGRRAAPREATPLIAVFSTVTRSGRATVIDVSTTGVRLRGNELPRAGDVLDVRVETIHAFGMVVWCRNGECGIEFDEPLCSAHVNLLRHRVALQAGLSPQLKAALDDWTTGIAR